MEYTDEFFYQAVEDNIIIFSNKTLYIHIVNEDWAQQVEVIDIKAISSKCEIRIPNYLTYVPSKLYQYSFNHSYVVRNYSHQFAEPELKLLKLKFRKEIPKIPNTWFYFSTIASPYLSITNVFLVFGLFIIGFLLFRCMVIRRLRSLQNFVTQRTQESTS